MEEAQAWKRALREVTDSLESSSSAPPAKKQKIGSSSERDKKKLKTEKHAEHTPKAEETESEAATPNGDVKGSDQESDHPTPTESHADAQFNAISDLIGSLEGGLSYVANSDNFSEETRKLVNELRKRLQREAASAIAKGLMSISEDSATQPTSKSSKHTDVPPPIPGVKPASDHSSPWAAPVTQSSMPPLPNITDLRLLSSPFTHTSALPQWMPPTGTNCYEPLEFLGDAYLEVIATRLIHNRFPKHSVGQKATLRESLIKNETLAGYAKDYGLGQKVKIVGVDDKQNSKAWQKVLADVFEAYVACIILSDEQAGFKVAEEWLHALWEPRVQEWKNSRGKQSGVDEAINMDIKSELQRFLVSKGVKLEYLEERPMELDKTLNRTTFHMAVYLTGWGYNSYKLGSGSGRSKQVAGAEAAKHAFLKSREVVDDAHRKKLAFDAQHAKTKQRPGGYAPQQQPYAYPPQAALLPQHPSLPPQPPPRGHQNRYQNQNQNPYLHQQYGQQQQFPQQAHHQNPYQYPPMNGYSALMRPT